MRLRAFIYSCGIVAAMATPPQVRADALTTIKETGRITLGVREASGALSFTLGPDKYTGYQVDVCERIVADIKHQLQLDRLEVRYQVVTPANRVPLVGNGTIQLECGSTTNNATRQKEVSFSPTTYVESVRIAVKASSPAQTFADLGGKTVVATTGTTAVQIMRRLNRQASKAATEVYGKDNADSFLALESGRADACLADSQILATLISKSKSPADFRILEPVLSVEPLAIMIPKDDPALKKLVDASVKALAANGTLARLYDRWFMQPIPPSGTRVGLPPSSLTKAAWAAPNDKPMEEYAEK